MPAPTYASDGMMPSTEAEARTAQMEEACYQGVNVACEQLSYEEEAKRAWLEKLDAEAKLANMAGPRSMWTLPDDNGGFFGNVIPTAGSANPTVAAPARWVANAAPTDEMSDYQRYLTTRQRKY